MSDQPREDLGSIAAALMFTVVLIVLVIIGVIPFDCWLKNGRAPTMPSSWRLNRCHLRLARAQVESRHG